MDELYIGRSLLPQFTVHVVNVALTMFCFINKLIMKRMSLQNDISQHADSEDLQQEAFPPSKPLEEKT